MDMYAFFVRLWNGAGSAELCQTLTRFLFKKLLTQTSLFNISSGLENFQIFQCAECAVHNCQHIRHSICEMRMKINLCEICSASSYHNRGNGQCILDTPLSFSYFHFLWRLPSDTSLVWWTDDYHSRLITATDGTASIALWSVIIAIC